MEDDYEKKTKANFGAIWLVYLNMYSCIVMLGSIQDSIKLEELPSYLSGTTEIGIGMIAAGGLMVGIISTLILGYFHEKIAEKYSRKKFFMATNLIWIICYFLIAFSPNFVFFMIVALIGAVGTGAFVPIGFSIIGDSFSPKERGDKFGLMQVGLLMGGGWGLIWGAILGGGAFGWRIVYIVVAILSLLSLERYRRVGIDPERGRAETAFEDFEGAINYDYKITMKNVGQILRKKSLLALLISILLTGIATSTLGLWTIYYFTYFKFDGNKQIATALYIGVMVSSLPGNIFGGRLGDKYFKEGKLRGRVIISLTGLSIGIILQMIFFLMPLSTPIHLVIFILLGIIQAFLCAVAAGNRFAIYSEVCAPELRSTVNSMHVMMVNMGGMIGNLVLASMVQANPALMPNAIALVLTIWLIGSTLWIVPYFSYPKEAKECDELMVDRRKELESKST